MIELKSVMHYTKADEKGFGEVTAGRDALGTKCINPMFIVEFGQHFEMLVDPNTQLGSLNMSGSWLKINDGLNISHIFTTEDYSDLKTRMLAIQYKEPMTEEQLESLRLINDHEGVEVDTTKDPITPAA